MPHVPTIASLTRHIAVRVAMLVWIAWAVAMSSLALWHLFDSHWFMSLTMAVGSFIAGSTSEGGGAVAFPVMTLGFGIAPAVARDFALMIQSIGMSAAAITIIATGIQVNLRAIRMALLGAAPGFILGAELLSPILAPAITKTFFVSFWLAFGLSLHFKHRHHKPRVQENSPAIDCTSSLNLLLLGFIGGAITGVTGCGLDIVVFSYLVMGKGLSEKTATPTSVVLMAAISIIGFGFRALLSDTPIPEEAWNHWWVSVPVVVVGAPLGTLFIARRSRSFVISLLCVTIVVQFIGALAVLTWSPTMILVSAGSFVGGAVLFMNLPHREPTLELPSIRLPSENSHA